MVKSVAPLAHPTQAGKNAKVSGAKGLAAALLAGAGKGTKKAACAMPDTKDGRVALPSFSDFLKKGIAEAGGAKEAQGLAAKLAAALGSAVRGTTEAGTASTGLAQAMLSSEKEAATKGERADSRKKGAATTLVAMNAVLSGPSTSEASKAGSAVSTSGLEQGTQTAVASKGAGAQQAQAVVRIVDLRKKPAAPVEDAAAAPKATAPSAESKDQTVSFIQRLGTARDTAASAVDKPAASASTPAQTPLERLREMAGSELTQAATMILKDGGGEIRLLLKPESLGSVRVRMNVVDNKIEGTIIVDSAAVKHVFDGSIDALRRALTAEGFQTGSLSVSVGGQGTDTGDRQQRQAPGDVQKIAARGFERTIPGVENMSLGDLLVNVFV